MLGRWNVRLSSLGLYIWDYFYNMTTKLSPLTDIERLSPHVIRILGQNPGQMTLQGTNCYLVHMPGVRGGEDSPARLCLIDTGAAWPTSSSFVPLLRESLRPFVNIQADQPNPDPVTALTDIVLTHRHADHIGGLKAILDVFAACDAPQPRIHKHRHPVLPEGEEGGLVDWDQLFIDETWTNTKEEPKVNWLADGHRISLHDSDSLSSGATLRVIHTPGHTPDSITLLLEETGELFTADTVLGQGTSVFTDLSAYMASLDKILAEDPQRLYPGHGPHIGDRAGTTSKIREYINHRLEREKQIIQAMKTLTHGSTAAGEGITVRQIVEILYAGLGLGVYTAAEKPVGAHLRKLEKDGRVLRIPDGKWKLL